MIESPLIQEIVVKERHKALLLFLEGRFGSVPADLAQAVRAVTKERRLDALMKYAGRCHDLEAFRAKLLS
jgi:hypothetical protein